MTSNVSSSSTNSPLWVPGKERAQSSQMAKFIGFINEREKLDIKTYAELHKWSVQNIETFWAAIWDLAQIKYSKNYDSVLEGADNMPNCKWFSGAKLNFAENILRYKDDQTAVVFRNENHDTRYSYTYRELYSMVAKLAAYLKKLGVKKGDRVAGYVANTPKTLAAMLATTSLGAVWTSCSPDFGWKGALDRFGQTEPKVLFASDGYYYNGKAFPRLDRIEKLCNNINSIKHVIVIPYIGMEVDKDENHSIFDEILQTETAAEIEFVQTEADHPVYILYSSGTTNVPKCITHGAIGTLLQHYKELTLHTNVSRNSTLFYFTTCGWMMWNWMASTLMTGAKLVLFDGSPFSPGPEVLWQIAEEEKLTVFGTSAKYLDALEASGLKPKDKFNLENLEVICSTGSPLPAEGFHYVYRDIKENVQLSSIAGGTDIISCFMLGNPMLPVYEEEIQCLGLGMDVHAFDEEGKSVIGQRGELVCCSPAPSMPIYFYNDPDKEKYTSAYFSVYAGIWHHGDYVEITEHGGVIMFGRSDATLNPGGVRIGTSEIYKPLDAIKEIEDSLVIGQKWDNDERVLLFVKLAEGISLTDDLIKTIKTAIRNNASPRHVPAKVIEIKDVPYTRTGKKVELAVRKVIHGDTVKNVSALANPEVLDYYKDLKELKK